MIFDISQMTCKDDTALFALYLWVDDQGQAYDQSLMSVFVDSKCDFCAVEFKDRPVEHTSRAHSLIECITSKYIPCVIPFFEFRSRVYDLFFGGE